MAVKKNTVTYHGTGRRKTSVARVYMTPGKGTITVNGKSLAEYLPLETLRMVVRKGWRVYRSGRCDASWYYTYVDGSKRGLSSGAEGCGLCNA